MNENTRLMLALGLTIVVLVIWNMLFPPPQNQLEQNNTVQKKVQQKNTLPSENGNTWDQQARYGKEISSNFAYSKGEILTIKTPLYTAKVNSQGGILEQYELSQYKNTINPNSQNVKLVDIEIVPKGPLGILWNYNPTWKFAKWEYSGESKEIKGRDKVQLTFKTKLDSITIIKTLTFYGNHYKIEEDITILNTSDHPVTGILGLTLATSPIGEEHSRFNAVQIVYYTKDKNLEKENSEKKLKSGIEFKQPINWAGIEDNYFLISVVPLNGDYRVKGKLEDGVYRVAVETQITVNKNNNTSFKNVYYIGPKKEGYLKSIPNNLVAAINYGWLDILAKPLVKALNFFYKYTGNYGIAIIILTIVIKILLWPLSHKSYKSMEQMKKIQPIMQQLKEKYKDDKQKLNEELMRLYKTYKINPAGGCVPMLLQIPVFIALYEALLGAIELRHSPFIVHLPFTDIIWLADLSAKDPLYITPILMGITMFIQQKMTPTSGDPTQAKMMLLMPVFLTFLFLNFPSGLVVYFITNNVLSIVQQWWLLKNNK